MPPSHLRGAGRRVQNAKMRDSFVSSRRRHTILQGDWSSDVCSSDLTIFVARFITGMRVIAGPLAGVLRMDWRKFAIFNFLGAAVWVTVISSAGFLFGKHWDELVEILGDANVAVVIAICVLLAILWWRRRRRAADRS